MDFFNDKYWMQRAIKKAMEAYDQNETPIGAIVVYDDQIIGSGFNQVETLKDPTAHAEILAITSASEYLQSWRLENTTLYVTKEPCFMCSGAILNARIPKLVFGVGDKRFGGAGGYIDILRETNKGFVEVLPGIEEQECSHILSEFFAQVRSKHVT